MYSDKSICCETAVYILAIPISYRIFLILSRTSFDEHNVGQKYHQSRDVDRWTFTFVILLKKNISLLRSCQAMSEAPLKCPL